MLDLIMVPITNLVPYDEAVIKGKKIITEIEDKQWELGELVEKLEPRYGDQTLRRFAKDIGVGYSSLAGFRATVKAWPQKLGRPNYSVARALNPLHNRERIVQDNPDLTRDEARKIAQEARGFTRQNEEEQILPYQEPCTDCNSAEEQWQRSVSNMLGDILSFRAYWDRLFGEDWKVFKLPSSHIKMAIEAKREFAAIVANLREHSVDEKN